MSMTDSSIQIKLFSQTTCRWRCDKCFIDEQKQPISGFGTLTIKLMLQTFFSVKHEYYKESPILSLKIMLMLNLN